MSQSLAIAEAKQLQAIVQRHGVKCTIELMPGRPWSGSVWYSQKRVLMNHHTAGPSSGLTPSYALCRKGRSDVPGPLCNGYGGRDHVFRIVTMGLANHPGAGGPLTVAGVTMPRNSARIASFGIEWEHNGTSPWPAEMREFMGRVGAAVLEWMARPLGASIEHKTWAPDRKIDRNRFTAASGQALIKQYQGGTPPKPTPTPTPEDDFDMRTDAQIEQLMKNAIAAMKPEIQDAAADGVDQSLNGKNVTSKLKALVTAGTWGAFFGRGENRKTAATVLATTMQQNAALLAVLSELEAEGKLSPVQAQRVAAAAVVEDVHVEPGDQD